MTDLNEQLLEEIYTWIDQVPLSRPKRDLKRDFSDGVLVAEVVKHFLPNCVDLHNYVSTLAVSKKLINWHILNRKVFKKMGFEVNEDVVDKIVNCQPFAIEQFLILLRRKVEQLSSGHGIVSDRPEVDQDELSSVRGPTVRKTASGQLKTSHRAKMSASSGGTSGFAGGQVVGNAGAVASSSKQVAAAAGGDVVVPRTFLLEKDEQLQAKDETIEILQAKVRRLEQLLQLKDIRIEDLQGRINNVKPRREAAAAAVRRGPTKC